MKLIIILFCLIFSSSSEKLESYSYYQDVSGTLSLEEIKSQNFINTQVNNLGIDNGIYWFKIDKPEGPRAILELKTAHAKDVQLFDSEHNLIRLISDTRYPSFFLSNARMSFPLYLKVNLPLEAYFPINISSEAEFASNDKIALLGIGFFYGTGLALMIATLMFFFILRNTQFLVFAALIVTIMLSVSSKDNILHLFGIGYNTLTIIESIGHTAIGITATSFMLFYLKIRRHQLWIKWSMITLSAMAFCAMIIYMLTKNDYSYIIIDITSITTLGLMWALILMIAKGKQRKILMVIYVINLFLIVDICILHHFGIEVIKFSPTGIALISVANFTLIASLLLLSFKRMQSKGVIMKQEIKLYLKQLKELDNYKNIQDTNDDYLQSLIDQFNLENIEVKILDAISKGITNENIASKYNLTNEKLKSVTNSLYTKLGLENTQDLGQLGI